MPITTTSQQFNRDSAGAKKAAAKGPVVITSRGEPSHVLLSFEEYRRRRKPKDITDLSAPPADDDFDFDIPRMDGPVRYPEF